MAHPLYELDKCRLIFSSTLRHEITNPLIYIKNLCNVQKEPENSVIGRRHSSTIWSVFDVVSKRIGSRNTLTPNFKDDGPWTLTI